VSLDKTPFLHQSLIKICTNLSQFSSLFDAKIFGSTETVAIRKPRSEADFIQWSNQGSSVSSRNLSRRHSSAGLISPGTVPEQDMYLHKRRKSSVAACPVSPTLHAMRLPSITEPAMHSTWRLSYSVPNRGEELRKLSQETQSSTSPPLPNWTSIPLPIRGSTRAVSPSPIGPRPLNRWLHSQGLRSPSEALSISEDACIVELNSPTQGSSADPMDFGGVDGSSPASGEVLHLHQMSISRRLAASRGLSPFSSPPTSPPVPRSESQTQYQSNSSNDARRPHPISFIPTGKTLDSHLLNESVSNMGGDLERDSASAVYISAATRYQPSANNSNFDLKASLARGVGIVAIGGKTGEQFPALTPTRSLLISYVVELKPSRIPLAAATTLSPMTGSGSPSSLSVPLTHRHSRATFDSSIVSETESHRHLEAELKVVKSRFAEAESRRSPSTPRSSRFREEFDSTKSEVELESLEPVTPSSTPRRRSTKATLTRLAKLAVRSYDGSMDKLLGVPIISPKKRERSPSKSLLDDSDALGAWGKAVKSAKNKESLSKLDKKKSTWRNPSLKHPNRRSEEDEDGEELTQYDKLMAKRDEVMDDWGMELERTAQNAKVKSKKITNKVKLGPDLRFPTSWARFPSHDRDERVLNLSDEEGVDAKDFAVHEQKDGKTIWYQNEKTFHMNHYPGDDHESHKIEGKKGFFQKLEEKFKDQLPKSEDADKDKDLVPDQTHGRRGSTILGLESEFPELEILPVAIMSEAEIEALVHEQLEQEQADRRREEARKKREAEEEELKRKEEELDAIFGGRKKKISKPESAIAKAKRAAEEARKAAEADGTPKSSSAKKSTKITETTGESPGGVRSSKMAAMTGESPQVFMKQPVGEAPVVEEEEERLDSAGMNTSVMEQQIAARLELKKKMEERRKARGGRRGPVARKKPADQAMSPAIERTASPASGMDGSDHFSEDETMVNSGLTSSQISIADPRYYADCIAARIFTPSPPPNDDADSEGSSSWDGRKVSLVKKPSISMSMSRKFGTWSGKNRYRFSELKGEKTPRMVKSFTDMDGDVRKSTEDFRREVEKDQERARIMAINAAKAAWGGTSSES